MKDKHQELLVFLNESKKKFEAYAIDAREMGNLAEARLNTIEAIKCSNSILHLESVMYNWQDEMANHTEPTASTRKAS